MSCDPGKVDKVILISLLTSHMLQERNVETPYASRRHRGALAQSRCVTKTSAGDCTARCMDRCAGLRCRKKRMPCCNRADTGCCLTGRESEPTSDRSLVARKSAESPVRGNANGECPQGTWCALRLHKGLRWQQASIAKFAAERSAAGGSCESGLMRGSSRMRGNSHVRFLGEPWGRKAPGLPGGRRARSGTECSLQESDGT